MKEDVVLLAFFNRLWGSLLLTVKLQMAAGFVALVLLVNTLFAVTGLQQAGEAETARLTLILGGVGTLVAVAASYLLVRDLKRGIRHLLRATEQVAAGDLAVEIAVPGEDEVARLGGRFGGMLVNLRDLIAEIRTSADQVAEQAQELEATVGGAREEREHAASAISRVARLADEQSVRAEDSYRTIVQLREAISQVAEGAEEQARQMADTSEAVGQVSERLAAADTHAREVTAAAERALAAARQGAESVQAAMGEVQTARQEIVGAAGRVDELGQRSQEIGRILDLIEEIAGQTHMLALNAAIEAARAGEQGRGFAVVADEVRSLAKRSADAAGEIGSLVASIQAETEQVLAVMHQGTEQVTTGERKTQEAGEALRAIVDTSETTHELSRRIQRAMAGAMETVRSLGQQTESVAAAAEESAAASQEMAAGSDSVEGVIGDLSRMAAEVTEASRQAQERVDGFFAATDALQQLGAAMSDMAERLERAVTRFKT